MQSGHNATNSGVGVCWGAVKRGSPHVAQFNQNKQINIRCACNQNKVKLHSIRRWLHMRAVHPVVVINFQVKVRLAPSLLTICSLPLGRMPQLQFQLYPQTIQPVALACVDSCTQITKISVHMQRSRCRQRCLLNLGNLLQIQPLPLPLSAIVSLGRICASGALLCN